MKQFVKFSPIAAILICCALMLNACGLIFSGTHDEVQMHSSPEQADIYIDGQYRGSTPMKLKLRSDQDYLVEFRKEGYETRTVNLTCSVGAGYVILDILLGVVPIIIDAATGGWYTLDQYNVGVTLPEKSTSRLYLDYK
ncbi:MAG: PEGA domain-containing protein [Candidatus Kapaibacterium sp.]